MAEKPEVMDIGTEDTAVLVPDTMTLGDIEKALSQPFLDIETDPLEAQRQIIARILNATDESEVFGGKTTVGARDMVDKAFTLLSVRILPGDFKDSPLNIYAAMDCVDEDGSPFVLTCGAVQVMAQVFWAHTHNKLPLTLTVREKEKATAAGYKPLWLEFPAKPGADF